MIGPNLIRLESVGSLLDVDTLELYPETIEGLPDWECATDLYETDIEWFEGLSSEDKQLLEQYGILI